jgi:hypothetical protein
MVDKVEMKEKVEMEMKVEEMKVEKVKTNESYSRAAKIQYMGLLLGNEQVSPLSILISNVYIISNFSVICSHGLS